MKTRRWIAFCTVLSLILTLFVGMVAAENVELPTLPEEGNFQYTNGLKLSEATSAITTTKEKGATRLAATVINGIQDISEYDYLHLWIYISDAALLYDNNGDGLELSSGGKQDKEEAGLYFSYTKAEVPTINEDYARLQSGWNEYLLRLSDFRVAAGGTFDPAALDFIGLVLRSNPAGLTFAMSEIHAVREEDVSSTKFGEFPEDSGIPSIPTTARYQLADTALQLTKEAEYGAAEEDTQWFRMVPELTAESLDLTEYQYVYLWIYITEADLHNGDSIEFCSGGAVDKRENAVRFNSWFNEPLKVGWNECLIPLSSFSYVTDQGWIQSAVNYISVVLRSKTAIQTGAISIMYAAKESEVTDLDPSCPVEEQIPLETARYQIKNTALQLTTKPFWATTAQAGKHVRLAPTLTKTSFDISDYDYIYTWLYLSATDLAKGDGIELTSGGTNDKEENAVRFVEWSDGSLQVGWNELMIPIDDFKHTTGGHLDLTALNFIGVVFRSQIGVMTGMASEIYALTAEDFVDTRQEEEEQPVGNGKLGRGELVHDFAEATATAQNGVLQLSAQLDSVVQPGYYTYLCAEIYVESKALLSRTDAALQISSSADEDVQELSYALANQSLYEGWNTVFLPIEAFRMSGYDYEDPNYGGICDLLNIRRVGINWAVRDPSNADMPVLKLGKIFLTNSNVTEVIPEGAYVLDNRSMAITTGEVSQTVTGGSSKQLVRLMPEINYGTGSSVDISDKQYLYFWLYVSNAEADDSTVSDNELELCSGGKCDEEENAIRLYRITEDGEPWLMSGEYGSFETGWNEYVVPIEDLTRLSNKSGEQGIGCDYEALNYLRIFFHTKEGIEAEDVTYAISTVYAINPDDLSEEGASLPDLNPQPVLPDAPSTSVSGTKTEGTDVSLSFTDVSETDWYYEEVKTLVGKGMMNGVSATEFSPDAFVSRGMLVTILYRMENCPAVKSETNFSDVPEGQWYTEAVMWAAEKGIVNGYGDGNFGPNDPVTREQIAAVLWRLSGASETDRNLGDYRDGDSVSAWAKDAVAWCVEEGILKGVDEETLSVNRTATRAEMAVILCRYLDVR